MQGKLQEFFRWRMFRRTNCRSCRSNQDRTEVRQFSRPWVFLFFSSEIKLSRSQDLSRQGVVIHARDGRLVAVVHGLLQGVDQHWDVIHEEPAVAPGTLLILEPRR